MEFHNSGVNEVKSDTPKRYKFQKEVACMMWTTTSGKAIPIEIRMKDSEDVLRTYNKILLHYMDKKNYDGITSYEFNCDILDSGLPMNVILQYYPEQLKYYLVIN